MYVVVLRYKGIYIQVKQTQQKETTMAYLPIMNNQNSAITDGLSQSNVEQRMFSLEQPTVCPLLEFANEGDLNNMLVLFVLVIPTKLGLLSFDMKSSLNYKYIGIVSRQ